MADNNITAADAANKIDDTLAAVSAVSVTAACDITDDADRCGFVSDVARRMQSRNVIYASGKLKAFLDAREKGASKELLAQLSADALKEQEEERSRMRTTLDEVVIDFQRARRERTEAK